MFNKNKKNPIAVVSIMGMKDTGKSYLLNHFLSALKAFKVGPKK